MGDENQYEFVKRRRDLLLGPVLEVGSHDYGSGQDLRSLAPEATWVGADLRAGPGVDVVLDIALPFEEVDAALGRRRFGAILCLSVLEHCADPFAMAANLSRLLAPHGRLLVSVPFAWEFHGYPSDYWRFTHEGVKRLFPDLSFPEEEGEASAGPPGSRAPLDEDLGKIPFGGRWHRRRGRFSRGLGADLLKVLGRLGPLRWLTGQRYVLAPTLVHMVGRRRDAG